MSLLLYCSFLRYFTFVSSCFDIIFIELKHALFKFIHSFVSTAAREPKCFYCYIVRFFHAQKTEGFSTPYINMDVFMYALRNHQ